MAVINNYKLEKQTIVRCRTKNLEDYGDNLKPMLSSINEKLTYWRYDMDTMVKQEVSGLQKTTRNGMWP